MGDPSPFSGIENDEVANLIRCVGEAEYTGEEIGDGVFEVKSTAGDTRLGGDDWDERVIDWLSDSFKGDHGVDLKADAMALQRLKEAGEQAKKD